jgi:hypothetical protein
MTAPKWEKRVHERHGVYYCVVIDRCLLIQPDDWLSRYYMKAQQSRAERNANALHRHDAARIKSTG